MFVPWEYRWAYLPRTPWLKSALVASMSRLCLALAAFFMIFPLATGRCPRTDNANLVAARVKTTTKSRRLWDSPRLTKRSSSSECWSRNRPGERIAKNRTRFLERNAVLLEVLLPALLSSHSKARLMGSPDDAGGLLRGCRSQLLELTSVAYGTPDTRANLDLPSPPNDQVERLEQRTRELPGQALTIVHGPSR